MSVILRAPSPPRLSTQRTRFPPTVAVSLTPSLNAIQATPSAVLGHFTRWQARIKPRATSAWGGWVDKAGSAASHSFTGLNADTRYDVQVRAYDHEFLGPTADATAETNNAAPPAPSIALTPGDTTIRVQASVPEGTALTKWQRRTGTTGAWTDIASTARSISFTVSGLANGIRYTIQVRAINGTATGATGQAQARPIAPTAPAAPSVSLTPSDTTIAVSASAPANATFTDWQWRVGNGSWQTVSHNRAALNVTATGLTNGTRYTIQVRLRNRGAVTTVNGATGSDTATPVAPATPPAPTVTLTPGNREIGVQASVPNGTAVTSWQWRRGTSGNWTTINSSSLSISFSATGLTNGTEYTIQVRARNQGPVTLKTGPHTAMQATPVDPISRDAPPAPTVTLTPGDRQIGIAASVAGSPRVTSWQWRVGSGDWTEVASTSVTFSATATGLTNGTEYEISVRAMNDASSSAGATTSRRATPFLGLGKPSLAMTGRTRGMHLSASVTGTVASWQYKIAASAAALSSASWVDVAQASGTLSTVVSGLNDDTTYFAQVRAKFGTTFSAVSDVESASTAESTPAKPSLTTEPGDTTIRLRASTAGPKVTKWQWRNGNGSWSDIAGTSLSLNHQLTGLTNDQTYRIQVRAVNGSTPGTPSDVREATPTPKLFSGSGTSGDPYRLAVPLSRFASFQDLLAPFNFLRSATETVHGVRHVSMVIEITPSQYARWVFDLDFTNSQQDFDLKLIGRIGNTWTELDSSTTTTNDENVGRTFDELHVDRIRLLVVPSGGWDAGNPSSVTLCRLKIVETALAGNRQSIGLPASEYQLGGSVGNRERNWVWHPSLDTPPPIASGLTPSGTSRRLTAVVVNDRPDADRIDFLISPTIDTSRQQLSDDFNSRGTFELILSTGERLLLSAFDRWPLTALYTFRAGQGGLSQAEFTSIWNALENTAGRESGSLILRDYDPLPPRPARQTISLAASRYNYADADTKRWEYYQSSNLPIRINDIFVKSPAWLHLLTLDRQGSDQFAIGITPRTENPYGQNLWTNRFKATASMTLVLSTGESLLQRYNSTFNGFIFDQSQFNAVWDALSTSDGSEAATLTLSMPGDEALA